MIQKKLSKILIVDDEEDILTIVKYALKKLDGIDCTYCTSGQEAIKKALEIQPDLILLDVMLPQMDGVATLKAIRLLPAIANTPIIFFTAKIQRSELRSYFELGIADIITKPFDPMTLPKTILTIWDQILKGER